MDLTRSPHCFMRRKREKEQEQRGEQPSQS